MQCKANYYYATALCQNSNSTPPKGVRCNCIHLLQEFPAVYPLYQHTKKVSLIHRGRKIKVIIYSVVDYRSG